MKWRKWEIDYLEAHANDGAESISKHLGRSIQSVQIQASRYGISLRKRFYCPNCGSYSFTPLSTKTGWCRCCTIRDSRDNAAIINRKVRIEYIEERRKVREAERERQALYSDTEKKRKKIRRFYES